MTGARPQTPRSGLAIAWATLLGLRYRLMAILN